MRRSIVVVGKPPRPGTTKTRLVPPLTFAEAANLYRGFLRDTVATALRLGWEDATLVHPADLTARSELRSLLPAEMRLCPQVGVGLGAALTGAFKAQLQAGFERVVLIGSDTPTLPPEYIAEAASALRSHDLVVGPSVDGGYYLIGMTGAHYGVFERIAWSTEVVFGQTIERARELGLRTYFLREWYDVDTVAELRRLRDHLRVLSPDTAPRTRRELARLAAGGLFGPGASQPVRGRPVSASRSSRLAEAG